MYLTPFQRRVLEHYRRHRVRPPTLLSLLKLALPQHLLMAVLIGLLALFLRAIGAWQSALLLLGMAMGAFLRDVGTFRRFAETWPVLARVLNWDRIDEMLGDRLDTPIVAKCVSKPTGAGGADGVSAG